MKCWPGKILFAQEGCFHTNSVEVYQSVVDPLVPFPYQSYSYYARCQLCGKVGRNCSDASSARFSFWNPDRAFELDLSHVDVYKLANEAYTKIMSYSINPTPYWIIVSDEGHAAIPARHLTKEAADAEAKRLTAAKPGTTFTVFESKYSLKTPKAEAVKTTYELPQYYWYTYPYNNWR